MKRITVVLLAAMPILAQVRGAGGGARGGGASPHPGSGFGGSSRGSGFVGGTASFPVPASAGNTFGYGSVVFPGGSPGAFGNVVNPSYINNQSFAGRLGTVVSGTPPLIAAPGVRGNGFNRGRSGGIYPVPVFIGGYGYGYGSGYYNGYYDNNGYYQDPQLVNQQPPVIINQNFVPDPPARPSMQVYGDGADPSVNTIQVASPSYAEGRPIRLAGGVDTTNPTDEPTIYLIALKDGTIYASYAFWAERDTLHYITPGHAQNQVSLDRVDVPLSRRLNRERNLDFNLK